MDAESAALDSGTLAGLIVADHEGGYFALGWEDLLRFRVPVSLHAALDALVRGAEPVAGEPDVRGYAGGAPAGDVSRLLTEALASGAPGRGRLAARRLSAWALLR